MEEIVESEELWIKMAQRELRKGENYQQLVSKFGQILQKATFQGEVTQASRSWIRDTSDSRKIHFGTGWLHIIIKGNNRKPQH